jgi:hypothetical protein
VPPVTGLARAQAVVAISAGLALAATPALGFNSNFGYSGSVEDSTSFTNLGFDLKAKPGGGKVVQHFTLTSLPIACSDSPDTTSSGGFQLHGGMRVTDRHFSGRGDWSTTPTDPRGSVQGVFHRGHTASGVLKLHGELAGPGTHCHTGELGWAAVRRSEG